MFLCSTSGLIIKPCVTAGHATQYQSATVNWDNPIICKGKISQREKRQFKKQLHLSLNKGTGVVMQVSVRLLVSIGLEKENLLFCHIITLLSPKKYVERNGNKYKTTLSI